MHLFFFASSYSFVRIGAKLETVGVDYTFHLHYKWFLLEDDFGEWRSAVESSLDSWKSSVTDTANNEYAVTRTDFNFLDIIAAGNNWIKDDGHTILFDVNNSILPYDTPAWTELDYDNSGLIFTDIDIVINADSSICDSTTFPYHWTDNPQSNKDIDRETIALHEFGHVFGLYDQYKQEGDIIKSTTDGTTLMDAYTPFSKYSAPFTDDLMGVSMIYEWLDFSEEDAKKYDGKWTNEYGSVLITLL